MPDGIAAAAGIEYAAGDPLHIFKKKQTPTPPSERTEYYVKVDCLDMTSLNGNSFVDKKFIDDARVIYNGTTLALGETSFTHKIPSGSTDYTILINFTGSVHDNVLCVRKPGTKSNLLQTLGTDAKLDLKSLAETGGNVSVELYKIPNWVNIDWVKQALWAGTAIYDHDVTVYLQNDEYTAEEWPAAKQSAIRAQLAGLIRRCHRFQKPQEL